MRFNFLLLYLENITKIYHSIKIKIIHPCMVSQKLNQPFFLAFEKIRVYANFFEIV